MSPLKSDLSPAQKATLFDVLQKIDRSSFAKLASGDLNYLYDRFVSVPYVQRSEVEEIGLRFNEALALLEAANREETQKTIRNTPSLCETLVALRVTVDSLGRGCEK